jgi:hypothetical protein
MKRQCNIIIQNEATFITITPGICRDLVVPGTILDYDSEGSAQRLIFLLENVKNPSDKCWYNTFIRP